MQNIFRLTKHVSKPKKRKKNEEERYEQLQVKIVILEDWHFNLKSWSYLELAPRMSDKTQSISLMVSWFYYLKLSNQVKQSHLYSNWKYNINVEKVFWKELGLDIP